MAPFQHIASYAGIIRREKKGKKTNRRIKSRAYQLTALFFCFFLLFLQFDFFQRFYSKIQCVIWEHKAANEAEGQRDALRGSASCLVLRTSITNPASSPTGQSTMELMSIAALFQPSGHKK